MPRSRRQPEQPSRLAKLAEPLGTIGRALTASAERSNAEKASKYRSLIQPWQQDAFGYYKSIGEVWYAAQFYARLSKLRIYAAQRDDQGELEELPEEHPASQLLSRIQDPGGGSYGEYIGSYGRLLFLVGEGYTIVTSQTSDDEAWEFVSCNELRVKPDGGYVRYAAPGVTPEEIREAPDDAWEPVDGTAVIWRMHRRDPEFSKLADSPMRAILPLCEELLLLQNAVRARATSRSSGPGFLYVPWEIDFETKDASPATDPSQDAFQQQLQKVLLAPIKDPGHAGSVAPAVLRGPAQIGGINAKDALFHLQIHDPSQTYPEEGLRSELISRMATGLDMPREVLLGLTDSNHWTGWKVDEDTWTSHLQPVADRFVGDLAASYLRPAAKAESIEGWEGLAVGYDESEIVARPDRSKDAKEVFDRGGISYRTLRRDTGYSEDDAQSEEEHAEYLAKALRDPLMLEGEEEAAQPSPSPSGAQNGSQSLTGPSEEEIPEQEESTSEEFPVAASARLEAILGAAQLAQLRTRELAGSRLLRFARRECPECVQEISAPKVMLASAIGLELGQKIPGGTTGLVNGGAEMFTEVCKEWGLSPQAAQRLSVLVERHTAQHLFERPQPLPPGFRTYVGRVLQTPVGT